MAVRLHAAIRLPTRLELHRRTISMGSSPCRAPLTLHYGQVSSPSPAGMSDFE
jgi:hypothetical protein